LECAGSLASSRTRKSRRSRKDVSDYNSDVRQETCSPRLVKAAARGTLRDGSVMRKKLIFTFIAATLVPTAAILWMSIALIEHSLSYVGAEDLNLLSKSLQTVARDYYRVSCEILKGDAEAGRLEAKEYDAGTLSGAPAFLRQFWESGEPERFELSQPDGDRVYYLARHGARIRLYTRPLNGVRMEGLANQYRQARAQVQRVQQRDLRKGLVYTLISLSAAIWIVAFAGVVYLANRISRPIRDLTAGLHELAEGNFNTRLDLRQGDEVGRAVHAFNHTANQLQQNRERLVYLTQIASWQTLARKTAHELKNSLTPIRLTVEEILARTPAQDRQFLEQAAQVVIEEVESLERRIRAFSEFAAEPAANPQALDLEALLEERIRFLEVAHPDVQYRIERNGALPTARADADQVKGILTNLLENAAEAAGASGIVCAVTRVDHGRPVIEVHDSGPGLSKEARHSLFEPTISFKKSGMGLGLSISRKNALLAGGDLLLIDGLLGGAGFRVVLPAENKSHDS
jgi:two-component system nitrogen regulation sensor histidine kinase NtrY